MEDGSKQPIENVKAGDRVLACYGRGDFRAAKVTDVFSAKARQGVSIKLRSGRELVSTLDHVHFAGYHRTLSPQLFLTYAMWRADKGFRVGTSRTYPDRGAMVVSGVQLRAMQEAADAAWIVSTHHTQAEARMAELKLSLRYRLPTLPFKARKKATDEGAGLVGDQDAIDEIFASFPTTNTGLALLADHGLDFDRPHHVPASHEGRRRNVTVTLCGDRRGSKPMHLVAVGGADPKVAENLAWLG